MRVYRVPISEGYAKHIGVYPRTPTVLVDFDDAKSRRLRQDQQWVQYDEDSKSPELRDNIPPGGRVLHSSHLQISELYPVPVAQDPKPSSRQVGGEHYKAAVIQPVEFAERNKLTHLEANVVKRVYRHSRGGKGREDIEKAIHELELLLEFQY